MKKNMINEMPSELKPRERLLKYGAKALSDYELLAIVLRTGSTDESVIELAIRLIASFENLNGLKRASLEELQTIKGIGPVKAIELQATIELGARIAKSSIPKHGLITSTRTAGRMLMDEMRDFHQEHLVTLFLNSRNEVIQKRTIFKGTVNSSVAHPREIFKEAVKYPTARLIIAHNHPSGDLTPSHADKHFTKRMIECGELMGMELVDHLIIGDGQFISLRETTDLFD